jgi:general secretion pathway protein F
MPQFRYRAVTPAGEIVAGEVDAPSRDEVVRRIEYLGHLLIDAEPSTKGRFAGKSSDAGQKPPRPRDVTLFLRQLGLLIAAGLTIEAALQTLSEDTSKALAWFANSLRSLISTGEGFAETLERYPNIIAPAYVAMIRAGEASGKLETVLSAIVEDRTRREALADRFNSAIAYPLFLVAAALLILFFFLLFVVPQFEPVFRDLGNRLNSGAAFVLGASTWLCANLQAFLGACLAIVLFAWFLLRRPKVRAGILGAFAAIPGIAGTMRDQRTARIVGTLALLVDNGVPLTTALKILRDIIAEPYYVAAIDRVHEEVRHGRRFSEALAQTDLLPPLAQRMLRVGDETGDLPAIARHAAHFYEHRLSIGLDRLMGLIGPATIIVVSLLIGALIVSIMSALLSITDLAT